MRVIPQPPKEQSADPPEDTIVVSVVANAKGEPSYLINRGRVYQAEIEPKLAQIFSTRPRQDDVCEGGRLGSSSAPIAEVIDMGHQAQVDNIGLISPAQSSRRAAGQDFIFMSAGLLCGRKPRMARPFSRPGAERDYRTLRYSWVVWGITARQSAPASRGGFSSRWCACFWLWLRVRFRSPTRMPMARLRMRTVRSA